MAFREFGQAQLSRRALLRGGAWLGAGAGAALAGAPIGGLAWARPAPVDWSSVTALAEKYVGEHKVANMVAAMGWGQQEPLAIARGKLAFGQTTPADLDSLYRIYSMTKPITGMAVMMLIDEGKLGLDQPLAEILPAFADMRVQKTYDGSLTDTVPAERPITIRHLLTHTAGLGYGIIQKGPIAKAYAEQGLMAGQISRIPIPGYPRSESAPSLKVFAERLAKLPLVAQPGTRWSYSVSLDLLGRVVEVVSAMPFDTFLQQRMFAPCGMASTWFRVPKSAAGRLTTNYGIANGIPIPIDPADVSIFLDEPAFPCGGSGLVSSPRDYDRFLRMLLGYGAIDGRRVMSEKAVQLGTSNLLPEGVITKGTFVEGAGFGAGGRVQNGGYGWGGAAGTIAYVSHKAGLRAGLYSQYMPSEAYPIQSAFIAAVLKDLAAMRKD